MSDAIDRELSDPHLKAVYSILWSWIGPPPSRASSSIWAAMMASYIEDLEPLRYGLSHLTRRAKHAFVDDDGTHVFRSLLTDWLDAAF